MTATGLAESTGNAIVIPDVRTGSARNTTDRNAGLDLLRSLACLLVVAYHLRTVLGVDFGPANRIVEGGDAGVFVFFALSGYLLYRPFLRGPVDLRGFALKRAARIFPGYFVALISLAILTRNPLPMDHAIPYLTMTASYNVDLRPFLGNAWTLSAELIFYLLLPAIARLVVGAEVARIAILGLGSIVAGAIFRAAIAPGNEWLIGAFPFVAYAFVPGMLLAVVERHHPLLFHRFGAWWVPLVGVAAIIVQTQMGTFPIALGAALGTPLLIGWLAHVRLPYARFLAFTGGASYALYLWHKDLFISFGVIGLLIAIVGAAASWAFVERPILELAHAVVARSRPARRTEVPVAVGTP